MTRLVIRRAGPADAPVVVDLIGRAFSTIADDILPRPGALAEDVATIADKLRDDQGLIAEIDGAPVGSLILEDRGEALYIGRLAVDPARMRQGIARTLMAEAEAIGRARGFAKLTLGVRLSLPGNIALFSACGFVETDRDCHPGFTEPTKAAMEKTLSD